MPASLSSRRSSPLKALAPRLPASPAEQRPRRRRKLLAPGRGQAGRCGSGRPRRPARGQGGPEFASRVHGRGSRRAPRALGAPGLGVPGAGGGAAGSRVAGPPRGADRWRCVTARSGLLPRVPRGSASPCLIFSRSDKCLRGVCDEFIGPCFLFFFFFFLTSVT